MHAYLPSPACAPLVGMAIRSVSQGGRRLLHGHVDPHGDNLCSAKLPGDGWRRNHDFIKDIIVSLARSSNYKCDDEITGLFSNILSGENLRRFINARSYRQRQGIVPGLLLQAPTGADLTPDRILYELKTLNSQYDLNARRRTQSQCGETWSHDHATTWHYGCHPRAHRSMS